MRKPLKNFNVTRVYADGSSLSLGTCRSVSEAKLRGKELPPRNKEKIEEKRRMLEAMLMEYSYKELKIEAWKE